MKVLLIKPPADMHVVMPPIGLGYLASYLQSHLDDVEVKIIDCLQYKISHDDIPAILQEFKPDVVGITAFTMEIASALKCCQIIKEYDNKLITVVGGVHTTNSPEEVLSNKFVDYIFKNEAEISFCEFIKRIGNNNFDFHDINNIGYMDEGKMVLNPLEFPTDLDSLPYPDYDLINLFDYPKTYMTRQHPYAPIISSRGCPYLCTYCSAQKMSGKGFRARSPQNIIEEIKFLKEKYKIKEFQMWDDNFTLVKSRTREFCELLLKEKINLPWWVPNGLRTETLDEDLIKLMKESGLYAIALGIESGSEKIQRDMKKNLNFERVQKVLEYGNKYGIRMQGFFIIGYPTETREDIMKTISLSQSLPLSRASFLLFQPLVGSEIYNDLERQGKLDAFDSSKTEFSKSSILPEGIDTVEELNNLHRKAILGFYLRPKVLFTFIIENMTVSQIKEVWKMIKKYIFKR